MEEEIPEYKKHIASHVKLDILLIIHDDALVDTFSAEMQEFNVRVHRAEELEEVFLCVEEKKLDAAFIDVDHPTIDPLHIIAAVRRSSSNCGIPIITIVPLDKMDLLEKASRAGATHFLPKPIVWFQMHRLMESIQWRLIDERRQYRRARAAIPVRCSYNGNQIYASSIDLSASGMLLRVDEDLPAGRELVLAFPYGDNYSVSFLLQARVVRMIEDKKRGKLVAVKFYNMPEARAQKLLMWVDLFLYFDEHTDDKEKKD